MELVYRVATETSPLITQIRNNVIVSVTPVADPDGRDRNVDWFYRGQEQAELNARGGGAGAGGGGRGGGRGGGQLPYWGKYAYHDNNRDFNVSQKTMRAIFDWYMQAHPPIVHDLHESEPLMYTYSGNAPQNPNLDPILWFELPFFSNFEVAQMSKWGMPGVWTHNFMDGWSPGYLGSMAYNHNAMMRMYETQSGSDSAARSGGARGGGGAAVAGGGRGGWPGGAAEAWRGGRRRTRRRHGGARRGGYAGRGGGDRLPGPRRGAVEADAAAAAGGAAPEAEGTTPGGFGRASGNPNVRQWYQGIPVPPGGSIHFTRRDNTNYMETGILCGLQITATFPNLIIENYYRKTQELDRCRAGRRRRTASSSCRTAT